jgi:peptidoglycan glycosyltransferase
MALSTSKEVPSNDEQSSGAMAAWRSLLRRSATVGALGLLTLAFSLTPSSPSGDASAADVPRSDSTGSRNDDSVALSSGNIAALQDQDQLALRRRDVNVGRIYPPPQLDRISVTSSTAGTLKLSERPSLDTRLGNRYANLTHNNNYVFYTIDPELQEYVSRVVDQAQASHVAVVAMNPRTGAILAIAGKSKTIPDIEYHAGFPAASLFKVVTAAAAVEQAGIKPDSVISYRGGTYTLNEWNYIPDARRDRQSMTVADALGRSCNPVFGHLGSRYLNGSILQKYAHLFGFNRSIDLEVPLPSSQASIPQESLYELSRTAAGFGEVRISPVHAAVIMSGVANGGLMPRPQMVEKIVSPDGSVIHESNPEALQRIVQPQTARLLMDMMEHTTTVGTSRREFMRGSKPTLGNLRVAGKTGTLKGTDPVGLNNWFIGAAPMDNPELAVSVITVDPRYSSKASHLGRLVIQRHFNINPAPEPARSKYGPKKSYARSKKPAKKSYSRSTAASSKKKKT